MADDAGDSNNLDRRALISALAPLAQRIRNELAKRDESRGEILAALLVIVGAETAEESVFAEGNAEEKFLEWATPILGHAFRAMRAARLHDN